MATAESARLIAQLILEDKQFQAALGRADRGVGKLESRFSKIGGIAAKGAATAATNIAKIGVAAGVVAGGLLAKSVQQASDLNEQINKSSVVFGAAAASVLEFSKTTAGSLGLSRAEALEAAGAFGNMFNTVGLTTDVSADFSKRLVTLAADMASFNNEDPSEMLLRLRSGLSGEAEPLRRFGVLLSEARVKEEAYATGIAKTGEKLTEAQKVQARYSLILKDTAVQQGDFSRTSTSLANQQRILSANLKNVGATIGTALLPGVTKLAIKLNDLIVANQPAIERFAATLPAAFDKLVGYAERIPWGTIAEGLKTAAEWSGRLFEVFTSMPPEAQATIVALAGLNKLTGGAVSGIVGELGKGLIKGVLNTNAAVMNVRAGVVNGVGGVGGAGGAAAAGGAAGVGSKLLNVVSKVFIVGMLAEVASLISGPVVDLGKDIHDALPIPQDWKDALEDFGRTVYGDEFTGARRGERRDTAQTGGLSPDERSVINEKKLAAAIAAAFGTHEAAITKFGSDELTKFRTTAQGAIDLFDERIRYLSGAQGSGAGSEQYLSLIQRDITALNALLPTATAEQAATIKGEIEVLEGILESKKFEPSQELIDAVASKTDKTNQHLEDNRAATDTGFKATYAALEGNRLKASELLGEMSRTTAAARNAGAFVSSAIERKDLSVKVDVHTVSNNYFTYRDQQLRARSSSYAGTMIGGK